MQPAHEPRGRWSAQRTLRNAASPYGPLCGPSAAGRGHGQDWPGLANQLLHHPPDLLDTLGRIGQVPEEAQLVPAVELVLLGPGLNELDEPRGIDLAVGAEDDPPARGTGLDLLPFPTAGVNIPVGR